MHWTFYIKRNAWNKSWRLWQELSGLTALTHCWQLHALQSQSPPLPEYKRSSLFVSTSFSPPLFSLYFLAPTPSLPWFFPPAWVSRTAQSPLMTPNQIYLHYFTSPCWNSYIWYIFNSISSGNVPLPDKSNHSNLETRKMHWDLKRQTRDIPLSVCVRVPQVKDHLLILVRRENTVCLAKRRWTLTEPWLKYTCKALSRTFQHIRTSQTLLRLVFAVV